MPQPQLHHTAKQTGHGPKLAEPKSEFLRGGGGWGGAGEEGAQAEPGPGQGLQKEGPSLEGLRKIQETE